MGHANARKGNRKAVIPQAAGIVGGLDQAKPMPKLRDYLEQIITTVTGPKATLDDGVAMLENLGGIGKLSAIGTAAILWHLRERWTDLSGKTFDTQAGLDADFQEFIFATVGYMTDTTRRYCLVMDFLNEAKVNLGAKSDVWEALLQRDIKDLIGLGQYTAEHGLLTKKQLTELADEPDSASLRKKLNEYKGKDEPAGGAQIILQPDNALEYWVGDAGTHIGMLIEPHSDLEKRGVAALLRRAKIQER